MFYLWAQYAAELCHSHKFTHKHAPAAHGLVNHETLPSWGGETEDNLALLKCFITGGLLYNLKETELEKVKDTTTKKNNKKTIKSPELVMKAADRGETARSIRDCCLL